MTCSASGGHVVCAEVRVLDVGAVDDAAVGVGHNLLVGRVQNGVDGQGCGGKALNENRLDIRNCFFFSFTVLFYLLMLVPNRPPRPQTQR